MHQEHVGIVIVGGGISGLSAAWDLQQSNIPYVLIEKSQRWGGKMITETDDGIVIEGGPEALVTRKPEVYELACELGLQAQIKPASGEARGIYILTHGRPIAVPLNPLAFILSPLMSWRGKLRLLAEPLIPSRKDSEDESLADFTRRRLGEEALERLVGPILGGIYNTNPHTQSILTTSPVMRELEAVYGGLVKGMLGRMREARRTRRAGTAQRPRFISFAGGTETLIHSLIEQLSGDLRLATTVTGIHQEDAGYRVELSDGSVLHAAGVILALPANAAASVVEPVAAEAALLMRSIEHTNIGTISLMYRRADLPDTLTFMRGLMIPRREKRRIDAITFTSHKEPDAAPEGYDLLKVFLGGGAPEIVALDDADLLTEVRSELRNLLGIDAEPVRYWVYRWLQGYPQAGVGHLDLVDRIETALPPGIIVTGSSYRGLAVPDCVRQGRAAAQQVIRLLNDRKLQISI